MPKTWDALADNNPYSYVASDFQGAAYQIVTEQVLYRSSSSQRVSYELMSRYRSDFQEAMTLLGIELKWDDTYRFVAAVPRQMKRVAMSRQQTLLVLVMRQAYHDQMQAGSIEDGSGVLTIEQLMDSYKVLAKREDLPTSSGPLRELLKPLQRYGMIRTENVDTPSGPTWQITILPGVAELISEPVLARLASAYGGDSSEPDELSDEVAEGTSA